MYAKTMLPLILLLSALVAHAEECGDYARNLESCTPYSCKFKHPFGGNLMEKKILGVEGGKCHTTEQMPNNGMMDCKLDPELRKNISQYLKTISTGGTKTSTSVKVEAGKVAAKYTVNGKDVSNPLQEANTNGSCKVSGY